MENNSTKAQVAIGIAFATAHVDVAYHALRNAHFFGRNRDGRFSDVVARIDDVFDRFFSEFYERENRARDGAPEVVYATAENVVNPQWAVSVFYDECIGRCRGAAAVRAALIAAFASNELHDAMTIAKACGFADALSEISRVESDCRDAVVELVGAEHTNEIFDAVSGYRMDNPYGGYEPGVSAP